jgi:RNA polymerase sigma factor (sigma-70 family)
MRLSLFDMNASPALLEAEQTDAELIALCRTGDRDAFARIVARYQSLICALAYSGVGNLAQSEDLARETFVAAWRHLPDLREPAKLRAWLCEIVRNRIHHFRRQQGREPTQAAEALDSAGSLVAPEPSPSTLAIQRDEETILWREMENIPELYREPLILFYRQNQSIANVAAALDLTEDAVKQRLSRGRKLLQEQVLAFVEGTLARTNPGPAFTSQVMAALPIAAGSAIKTAPLATAAAKAATAAKATGILGWLGALMWPIIVPLASLSNVIDENIENARPKGRERAWGQKTGFGKLLITAMLFFVLLGVFLGMAWELLENLDTHTSADFLGAFVFGAASLIGLTAWNSPTPWKIKKLLATGAKQFASLTVFVILFFIVEHNYKSTLILLGITLLGLLFVKLAKLGDPHHWQVAIRATGTVIFITLLSRAERWWVNDPAFYLGACLVTGMGIGAMKMTFRRKALPPDSTV